MVPRPSWADCNIARLTEGGLKASDCSIYLSSSFPLSLFYRICLYHQNIMPFFFFNFIIIHDFFTILKSCIVIESQATVQTIIYLHSQFRLQTKFVITIFILICISQDNEIGEASRQTINEVYVYQHILQLYCSRLLVTIDFS